MFCVRIALLILLLIFTAAATCSQLFALMRAEDEILPAVYTWHLQRVVRYGAGYKNIIRLSYLHYPCTQSKTYYMVCSILSVAGAAVGLLAALISAGYAGCKKRSYGTIFLLLLFSFIAFACYGTCTGLVVTTYLTDECNNDKTHLVAYKDQGYKLVEGFGLMVAACGGYLICTLISLCA